MFAKIDESCPKRRHGPDPDIFGTGSIGLVPDGLKIGRQILFAVQAMCTPVAGNGRTLPPTRWPMETSEPATISTSSSKNSRPIIEG